MTGTDIVPADPTYRPGMSSIEIAPAAWQLAHRVAGTEFVPTALRGKPEAVLACILAGHEAGISPMQALAKIHIIEGRPAMAAELMRALVLQHGHDLWIEESTSTRVTVGGKRQGSIRETKVTWTLDDAKRAGLDQRKNWKGYPRAMLTARATAELCRAVFPDVLAGISHTVEELTDGDIIDVDLGPPEVVDATAPAGRAIRASRDATAGSTTAPSEAETRPPVAAEVPLLPGEDDITDGEIVEDNITAPAEAEKVDEDPPESSETVVDPAAGMFPPDADPAVDTGPRLSGPQLIAMKFGAMGIDDRDLRLKMTSEMVGRAITSGNDLTIAEIHTVLEILNTDPDARTVPDVDAGTEGAAATTSDDPHEVTAPEASEASSGQASPEGRRRRGNGTTTTPPDEWTGDMWRDLLKRRGVKAAELLKHARTLAEGSIPTLDDLAGLGIGMDLVDFVEDKSLSR